MGKEELIDQCPRRHCSPQPSEGRELIVVRTCTHTLQAQTLHPQMYNATTRLPHLRAPSEVPFSPPGLHGRKTQVLPEKLATPHKGQMGARSGIRLPHSLYAHTHPILLPPATHNGGGIFIHSDRNLFSSATGGHCGATEDPSRGLLLHCIHSPQEGRRPTTYHKPEEPQQVHSPPTFQDGGYPYSKGRYLLWGLHDQARLEGCLLYDSGHTLALAHMIGIFSSTIPAVLPAPLH